ncbi:MAG: hypothetical protein AABZ74_17420 [Cyanobacteriota bacterium]
MKYKLSTLNFIAIIVILFGLATLKEGGSIIFNIGSSKVYAGNYVPFVLWFNFFSGFVYITAGFGLWFKKNWASKLSLYLFGSILFIYALFITHILFGGLYETRTIFAMALRAIIWAITAFVSFKMLTCKKEISA